MSKEHIFSSNSSFISIWKGSSKNLLPYTNGHEKDEIAALDIDGLGTIGRILRVVKGRIEAAEDASKATGGNLPGPAATGPNSSQNTHSEGR